MILPGGWASKVPIIAQGMTGTRALSAITDEIMYAILALSEQEYVDRYAAVVKAEEAAAKPERERKFPRMPLS